MIFQVHKKHGKHIAYTLQEAERNHKMGWKDVSEEVFYNRKKTKPEEVKDDKAD